MKIRTQSLAPYSHTDILQHSQQDLKNRVSERKIKVFKCHLSQETRFLTLVQDISIEIYVVAIRGLAAVGHTVKMLSVSGAAR